MGGMARFTHCIKSHYDELERLSECPGVEIIQIDFGLQLFEPIYYAGFPEELLKLIADHKISLNLSIYSEME
jgi:hypothetical protein